MASNYTANYQLNQWDAEDKVLRADFNADNLKIDGALAEGAAALELVKASALKIATGTYIGNGKYGYGALITLDFSSTLGRAPKLLIIHESADYGFDAAVLIYGMTRNGTFTWSDTSVSWYGDTPNGMFNAANVEYRYFAIG